MKRTPVAVLACMLVAVEIAASGIGKDDLIGVWRLKTVEGNAIGAENYCIFTPDSELLIVISDPDIIPGGSALRRARWQLTGSSTPARLDLETVEANGKASRAKAILMIEDGTLHVKINEDLIKNDTYPANFEPDPGMGSSTMVKMAERKLEQPAPADAAGAAAER